jgi:hypothetical protein
MHDYVDNITIDASRAISNSDDTNNYINNFTTILTWLVAQREDALIGEGGSSAIRPMRAQNPIGLGRTSSSGTREAAIADGTVAPAWSKDQGLILFDGRLHIPTAPSILARAPALLPSV